MATLTIRDLDDELKTRLRIRAAQHGHSMEAEARAILREMLDMPAAPTRLGTRVHERFARFGGVELELPQRHEVPRVPDLRR